MRNALRARVGAITIAGALLLAACGTGVVPPPDSAGAEVVLKTYLKTLAAGDCWAGTAFWAAGSRRYGDLCGHVQVTSVGDVKGPAKPTAHEEEYAVTLTVAGADAADGMTDGTQTWFFVLVQQDGGPWRIQEAGSGA